MSCDTYFLKVCNSIAKKSHCLSRNIGAILVRDNSIVSTGYNGPARGIPHCSGIIKGGVEVCPRKAKGYPSGTHMEECPAQHAEENTISNAARLGVSVLDCTCYLNTLIPCKNCFSTLINAGIIEIVCVSLKVYDEYTQFIIDNSSIKIRTFEV
jgi:dCMP deaminase